MDEILDEIIPEFKPIEKIYKKRAILVGAFFGGPIIASYLMAANFKAFGQNDKVVITWIVGVFAIILVFGSFFIPVFENIPDQIFTLVYMGATYLLWKKFQEPFDSIHNKSGGTYFGWGRLILISLIGTIITLALAFGIISIMPESMVEKIF